MITPRHVHFRLSKRASDVTYRERCAEPISAIEGGAYIMELVALITFSYHSPSLTYRSQSLLFGTLCEIIFEFQMKLSISIG